MQSTHSRRKRTLKSMRHLLNGTKRGCGTGASAKPPYSQQSERLSDGALHTNSENKPTVLSEWNDTLWTVMVEKAIVHKNGEITFVFYNGTKFRAGK